MIDSTVLFATDIDSDDNALNFTIKEPPRRGQLMREGSDSITHNAVLFSSEDLSLGIIDEVTLYRAIV